MGYNKLKQKVATALVMVMSTSAALSAVAATVGTPSSDPTVKVKFNPNGGIWTEDKLATKSEAKLATMSNAAQSKEDAPILNYFNATPSDATKAPTGSLERWFTMNSDSVKKEFYSDENKGYFVNLGQAKEWFADEDWKQISNSTQTLAGWLVGDDPLPITDDTEIYNGAELTAKWVENITEVKTNVEGLNPEEVFAEGLPAGATLNVEDVKDAKEDEELNTILKGLTSSEGKGKFRLNPKKPKPWALEINIGDFKIVNGKAIISIVAKDNFIESENDQVKAIHIKDDGEAELLNVKIKPYRNSGRFSMTFEVGSFSPFYFVHVEEDTAEEPKPETPSTSGGSSGGGRSSSATREATMNGKWVVGDNGWKFLKDNGEYATNTWGYIKGQWYFFDAQGNMVTGWYFINDQWYYMNPAEGSLQGAMLTGWVQDPNYNGWFYLNASGAMLSGWNQIGGKWYYMNPISDGTKGLMAANTYIDNYYVGADGAWVQ